MKPGPEALPSLVIFDLDGVIYRGLQPVAGAAELTDALRASGVLIRFATNNSMATRATYVERLSGMGIQAAIHEIVTSTSAAIDHLRAKLPEVRRLLAVGAQGMLDELRAAGFDATSAANAVGTGYDGGPLPASYDAVIAGLDPAFDYLRLAAASTALRAGARFIATNADLQYPTPVGLLPGAGSIVAALRAASGIEPIVIGKPEPGIFLAILEQAGVQPHRAIAIGDNPDADMVAAHRAGIDSILVLTGIATSVVVPSLTGDRRPGRVARDPAEVARLLGLTLS